MKKILPFTFAAFAASATLASAQVSLVSFGGADLVSANQNLGGNGSQLDPDTSISPAAGYAGQTFYGGVVGTNASIGGWRIENNTVRGGASMPALDWMVASVNADGGAGATAGANAKYHRGVVLFQQSDFSNYSNEAGGVTLQSLSFAVTRVSGNPSRIGFVIESAGAYYLSSPVTYSQTLGTGFNANFTNGHFLSISDVTTATWNNFNPESSFSSIGGIATVDFTKVTGVGFWFENERAGNNNAGLSFAMTGFNAVGVSSIPEPSAFAALAGLGALGLVASRRRRR